MRTPRISASSYSNTAPLIWSFLYGRNRGKVEIILDNAPARSAELLATERVDAALVPVFAFQTITDARLFPGVCIGAREYVRSVCLVTKGSELRDVRTISLDRSSRTSIALTKIIFREFLGFEPEWHETDPDIDAMLAESDCALLIGDPALQLSMSFDRTDIRVFDLAELWKHHTGHGFVFAMWMTLGRTCPIDFAAARDEGLGHIDEIISNYRSELDIADEDMREYLTGNISYEIDDSMQAGLKLFFDLAQKHRLIQKYKPLKFVQSSAE